jgi:hypothetical protein
LKNDDNDFDENEVSVSRADGASIQLETDNQEMAD